MQTNAMRMRQLGRCGHRMYELGNEADMEHARGWNSLVDRAQMQTSSFRSSATSGDRTHGCEDRARLYFFYLLSSCDSGCRDCGLALDLEHCQPVCAGRSKEFGLIAKSKLARSLVDTAKTNIEYRLI